MQSNNGYIIVSAHGFIRSLYRLKNGRVSQLHGGEWVVDSITLANANTRIEDLALKLNKQHIKMSYPSDPGVMTSVVKSPLALLNRLTDHFALKRVFTTLL